MQNLQRCEYHAGCRVGDDCTLYPNVTLYHGTKVDDRVLIHAGATLGAFGFGYRMVEGRHQRTAQMGWVHIESDVEIGAGTTVDRGTFVRHESVKAPRLITKFKSATTATSENTIYCARRSVSLARAQPAITL